MKTLVLLLFTTTRRYPDGIRADAGASACAVACRGDLHRAIAARIAGGADGLLRYRAPGFADAQFEDRYTFRSVAMRTSDGRVTDANVQTIGHLRGCVGQTADPLVMNFYAEGQLSGVALIASGQCRAPRADHPEPGARFSACSFALRGLPAPYLSGHLTTSTMTSRQVVGGISDPSGYVQPSIATIRLWKKR